MYRAASCGRTASIPNESGSSIVRSGERRCDCSTTVVGDLPVSGGGALQLAPQSSPEERKRSRLHTWPTAETDRQTDKKVEKFVICANHELPTMLQRLDGTLRPAQRGPARTSAPTVFPTIGLELSDPDGTLSVDPTDATVAV